MPNKYAVGLYSVRDELKKDLWGTLRKIKAMGYDGVEFFHAFTVTAQELKAALDETGLVCVGWHAGWDSLQPDQFFATVTYNKVIGNTEIVIPWIPEEMRNSKATWLETAKLFDAKAEELAHYGMNLAYHNHFEEFQPMDGGVPIQFLFDNTCRLGLQLDNGNAWMAGPDTDIYDPISRYAGRVRTIHHKPFSLKTGHATMIGEDDIDWGRFFKLCCEHQDIDWHIIEYECEQMYGQMEGIEKCIQAIKKLEKDGVI
jgi:sugar phosphate isomerase/epimerase